ncbi:siderophore-interacting protein [Paracoccus zhejiangensis]|uniref:Siderophore-interacting protein n=1 Tax=Paracoccus zhejiangensis TaxID=1077935 RepID=A0A2H5F4M7_9RHOB|nr:siderophore-interacting protein [Paracoccus zhejiangensis]AUH66495.1 siderophore-interacting protein [Paracoccus zhejiangensis]
MSHHRSHRRLGLIRRGSGAAIAALQARAAAWDVPLSEHENGLSLSVWGSELRLTHEQSELRIELLAPEERLTGVLRDSATELFAEVGISVEWDDLEVGALAPGLSLMRVLSVTRPSPNFLRVWLAGADAARLATGGLHFRLLLPPAGRDPAWPRVGPTGRTVWPEGADALHRPVYTVLNQEGCWLDFDIFRHADSPTCHWAEGDPVGQTIGVMGPGGGACPEADRLWLYGDATALPAITRMMRLARGRVSAMIDCHPEDLGELAGDPRVKTGSDLLGALRRQGAIGDGDVIWFAAGAKDATAARVILKDAGVPKRQCIVAAYWS